MWGAEKPMAAALNSASVAVNAFNPLGQSGSFLAWAMPTWADPVVELSTNKNWTGEPIKPEQSPYGPPKPESQLYWSNTGAVPKDIANFLHEISGGTNVRSGLLEVSPETIKYLYNYMTGATGQFATRMANLGADAFTLNFNDLEMNDVPFARKLVGSKGSRADAEYFGNALNDVKLSEMGVKKAMEDGDREEAQRIMKDERTKLALAKPLEQFAQRISELKTLKRKIEANDKLSPEAKRSRKDAIDAKVKVLQDRGNMLYYRRIDAPGLAS